MPPAGAGKGLPARHASSSHGLGCVLFTGQSPEPWSAGGSWPCRPGPDSCSEDTAPLLRSQRWWSVPGRRPRGLVGRSAPAAGSPGWEGAGALLLPLSLLPVAFHSRPRLDVCAHLCLSSRVAHRERKARWPLLGPQVQVGTHSHTECTRAHAATCRCAQAGRHTCLALSQTHARAPTPTATPTGTQQHPATPVPAALQR